MGTYLHKKLHLLMSPSTAVGTITLKLSASNGQSHAPLCYRQLDSVAYLQQLCGNACRWWSDDFAWSQCSSKILLSKVFAYAESLVSFNKGKFAMQLQGVQSRWIKPFVRWFKYLCQASIGLITTARQCIHEYICTVKITAPVSSGVLSVTGAESSS